MSNSADNAGSAAPQQRSNDDSHSSDGPVPDGPRSAGTDAAGSFVAEADPLQPVALPKAHLVRRREQHDLQVAKRQRTLAVTAAAVALAVVVAKLLFG